MVDFIVCDNNYVFAPDAKMTPCIMIQNISRVLYFEN